MYSKSLDRRVEEEEEEERRERVSYTHIYTYISPHSFFICARITSF